MPVVLKIDPQRKIVSSTFHGRVTTEELLRHQAIIRADHDFQPHFADVTDLSAVSVAAFDGMALTELASRQSIFDSQVPHVIVAPEDMSRDLASKYRDLARRSRPNLHIVRTVGEARELLDRLGYQF